MPAIPLEQAAGELGVSPRTLHRWIGKGAPATPGAGGRGKVTLVDPHAVASWRRRQARAETALDDLQRLVVDLEQIAANAVCSVFRESTGPHKADLQPALLECWYRIINTVRARRGLPAITERETPLAILQARFGDQSKP